MTDHFRSARLVYRALEIPEDVDWYYTMQTDAVALANSSLNLLRPHSRAVIETKLKGYAENPWMSVVICLPASVPGSTTAGDNSSSESKDDSPRPKPTPVGAIGLNPDGPQHHRAGMIGLDIRPEYRNKGYGTEAIEWIMQWGFRVAGLHRIVIGAVSYNTGGRRLYERMGFVHEGTRREAVWYDGEWHDIIEWALLEREWRERQGRKIGGGEVKVGLLEPSPSRTTPSSTLRSTARHRPRSHLCYSSHYWGGSPSTYSPVLRQPELNGVHSIFYHARGWAPSTGPDDAAAYSILAMSSDLAHIVHATGVDDVNSAGFVLVGHSMGAKVAQHYAATSKPAQLKALLLLAPAPLRGLGFPDEVKAQQRDAYESSASVEFVLDHVLTAGPGTLAAQGEERRRCVVDSLRGNRHAKAAWPDYGAEEECGVACRDIEVPVVVLRGDRDFEREVVGQLGVEEGWRNVVVEGCGHLVPLERPDVVTRELRRILDTN